MNSNLKNVTPYLVSERITSSDITYLDWNESVHVNQSVVKHLTSNLPKLNLYPDPNNTLLKQSLAKYTGVLSDFIEAFNGSDAALETAFRALINPDTTVLIPYPNYSQVNPVIQSLGGKIEYCDISHLEESIKTTKPDLVYLSNPNNPIGYIYDIKPVVVNNPGTYFIVDEAYFEFHTDKTVFDLAYRLPNLVVTRTFSKGLGMAGLRLGYLTSNSYILDKIKSIKNFKQVNVIAESAGKFILDNIDKVQADIEQTNEIKADFLSQIKGVRVYDSYANFVLIEHPRAKDIIETLKSVGLQVRDRSQFISNTVRITIGKSKTMNKIANIINNQSI